MCNATAAQSLLLLASLCVPAFCEQPIPQDAAALPTYEEYLRQSALDKAVVDTFLSPEAATWAQFDPELGYILGNSMPQDGMDGSRTISTVQPNGARTSMAYTDKPCRINTYGNSFTQCHQVSDGETWQEYLAAHFGEPIRNFGMGGYGTYQAYRRMVREESTDHGAEHVILYLWGDDHLRSVMRCRHAVIYRVWDHQGGRMFHNNFWANIELNPDTGEWVERDSMLPTPESMYNMCDPEFMVEALQDDLMVMIYAAVNKWTTLNEQELLKIDQLAAMLDVPPTEKTSEEALVSSLERIMNAYGYAATKHILSMARTFCEQHNKKLLIVTFDPGSTFQLLHGNGRNDGELMTYLDQEGFLYFDVNLAHLQDFEAFNLTPEAYIARYCSGHYTPVGNHFFAFQLKDPLVKWLDPAPITYRKSDWNPADFQGYLPKYHKSNE